MTLTTATTTTHNGQIIIIFPSLNDGKIQWSTSSFENVADMCLLDQSGVTGGGLDPYSVHALFVNMDNM